MLVGGAAAWLVLVALGLGLLINYSVTPGREGNSPRVWPATSRLARSAGHYMLVLAAHPHCPCTRATLSELEVIMTRCQGRLSTRVLFIEPEGFTDGWAKHDLWRMAQVIPGVEPVLDPRGVEARRFGAYTSGQAALYDPEGRLVFSGGITGARGHAGSNAGRTAVVALVESRPPRSARTPVFGCPLQTPATKRFHESGKERQSCPSS
jgi:hypothetical protein